MGTGGTHWDGAGGWQLPGARWGTAGSTQVPVPRQSRGDGTWLRWGVHAAGGPQGAGAGTAGVHPVPPTSPTSPNSATPTRSEPLRLHPQSPRLRVESCPQLHGVSNILWGVDPDLRGPLVGGHEPYTPGLELGPQLRPGWLHPILPPIPTGTASSHWVCFHLNGDICVTFSTSAGAGGGRAWLAPLRGLCGAAGVPRIPQSGIHPQPFSPPGLASLPSQEHFHSLLHQHHPLPALQYKPELGPSVPPLTSPCVPPACPQTVPHLPWLLLPPQRSGAARALGLNVSLVLPRSTGPHRGAVLNVPCAPRLGLSWGALCVCVCACVCVCVCRGWQGFAGQGSCWTPQPCAAHLAPHTHSPCAFPASPVPLPWLQRVLASVCPEPQCQALPGQGSMGSTESPSVP
nr:uncharacterized protein LOC113459798 [Zonotrichia albicollis]